MFSKIVQAFFNWLSREYANSVSQRFEAHRDSLEQLTAELCAEVASLRKALEKSNVTQRAEFNRAVSELRKEVDEAVVDIHHDIHELEAVIASKYGPQKVAVLRAKRHA